MLSILTQFLSNRSQHIMVDGCRSKLVNVVSGVPQSSILGPLLFFLYTSEPFPILENKLIGYADDSTLIPVVPSPGVRVTVAESLSRDLINVSAWCYLLETKFNANKTETMIVSMSRTMHPQSPALTIGGTVLKESDDLFILGLTFVSNMTFEKHLRSVCRAASQRVDILRKSWQVFHDRLFLGGASGVLSCRFWSTVMQCGTRLHKHLKLPNRVVSGDSFLTLMCLSVTLHIVGLTELCMVMSRCNPFHPLYGVLPGPYVSGRVTSGAVML